MQIFKERLEGRLALLLVVAEMGGEKRNSRSFQVQLSIGHVIASRVREETVVWREKRLQYNHSTHRGIQAAGSRGGNGVSV